MSLASYVPTDYWIIDEIIGKINLKPTDNVYDIGCGDGRVLIELFSKYKINGVGIESNQIMSLIAKETIIDLGYQDNIKILEKDVFDESVKLKNADFVYLYLTPEGLKRLKPKLESQLKKGSRVLSKDYEITGWMPEEIISERGYDFYFYVLD